MRYPGWFKRAGKGALHPKAFDVGRKLLGYITVRKQTPGVETLVMREELDDGTIVEASFHGSLPRVVVHTGGAAACELYVESGMLDLGANIAGDASQRFDRGAPEFDDTPARLFFGTDVDCAPGTLGMNGRVRVLNNGALTSQCLPSRGTSVESRLSDPAKKKAQAVLPASCWSGLMHRYVQAVYGGNSLDYSVAGTILSIEGTPMGGIGSNVGLVEVEGRHLFVFVGADAVSVAPIRFKEPCGKAVYRMWQAKREKLEPAAADKILTIALSTVVPDMDSAMPAGTFESLTHVSPYGWQFNPGAAEAHTVAADDSHTSLCKLEITKAGEGYAATVSTVGREPLAPTLFPCVIHNPDSSTALLADTENKLLSFGERFDHPVVCYYAGAALVVVRYTVESPEAVIEPQPGWDCRAVDGEVGGGRISWPIPSVEDARNCAAFMFRQYGISHFADGFNDNPRSQNLTYVSAGLYADRSGEVLWSTVRMHQVIAALLYVDDGTMNGSPDGKTWSFQRSWGMYVRTVNLGAEFSRTTTMTLPAGSSTGDPPTGFESFAEGSIFCTTLQAASQDWGFPVADYCNHRGPTIFGTDCTEWEPWVTTDTTGHTLDGQTSRTVTCTTPCRDAHQHAYDSDLMLGPQTHLALPRGDCAAVVAVSLNVSGTKTGDNPYSVGYSFTSRTVCNPTLAGDCAGVWMQGCNGIEGGIPTHAPHDFLFANYSPLNLPYYQTLFTTPNDTLFPYGTYDTTWRKQRIKVEWRAVSASAAKVHESASRDGAFEELLSGSELAWEPTENPVTCEPLHSIVWGEYTDEPMAVASADGETSIERMLLDSPYALLQQKFAYVFRRGLLDAQTHWTNALTFGASVGMDHESLTGGYSAVNTPSFVGWA